MWWECIPPGNGLDSVSQCQPSFVEVFDFFEPAYVNLIGGSWCVGQQHHVGELPSLLWSSENLGYTIPEGEAGSCQKSKRRIRRSSSERESTYPCRIAGTGHYQFPQAGRSSDERMGS